MTPSDTCFDTRSILPDDDDGYDDIDDVGELDVLHDREYRVRAFRLADDRLLIRGAVRDQKPPNLYIVEDDQPLTIHHMQIDLEVAFPSLEIVTASVRFETHPHGGCPAIIDHYGGLVGLSIARGFTHKVRELFGGPRGCTHTTALLQAMAPVAVQCFWSMEAADVHRRNRTNATCDRGRDRWSANLNTCHVWAEDGELVTTSKPAVTSGSRSSSPSGWPSSGSNRMTSGSGCTDDVGVATRSGSDRSASIRRGRGRAPSGSSTRRSTPPGSPTWTSRSPSRFRPRPRRLSDQTDFGYRLPHGRAQRPPACRLRPPHEGALRLGNRGGARPRHDRSRAVPPSRPCTAFSEPGDGVITQLPIYPPFLMVIDQSNRRASTIRGSMTARASLDIEVLRRGRRRRTEGDPALQPPQPDRARLHAAELQAIGDSRRARHDHGRRDEIHADLTYPDQTHIPIATLSPEIAARTITVTSATKAFNLAGLPCAVMHAGSDMMRSARRLPPAHYLGAPNVIGGRRDRDRVDCW